MKHAPLLGALLVFAGALVTAPARADEPPSSRGAGSAGAPPTYVVVEPSALGPRYRSPGLAAALSLTPVPVDFGNFYAENVGWGTAYTVAELGLGAGMMWVGADHMCHGGSCSGWSGGDTSAMVAMVAGYVAIKVVAAVQAAEAARTFDEAHGITAWVPVVAPTPGGASLGLAATF